MNYHERILESRLKRYWESFPCVLVSGARQVGKSTLLNHLFSAKAKAFVFDPSQDLFGARSDPDLFLRNNPPPLILDEIQYAPELVPALKRYVDQHRHPGMFLITGSQQWQVMKNLSESLAGRVAFLELPAYSVGEMYNDARSYWFSDWLENVAENPRQANEHLLRAVRSEKSPASLLWRGSFPEVQTLKEDVVGGWMQGYITTYLQRDVRLLLNVRNESQFARFLSLCSALTAQECNYSQMGRDIGLSVPAAQNWTSVLKGTFQWLEVPAYSNNEIKKLSQKPKGYVTDTGLACHLLRLSSSQALSGHPSFGSLFETFVVMEIYKQMQKISMVPALYHFRQHSGAEVDLLVERDGVLYPIEIKAATTAKPRDAQPIMNLQEKLGDRIGPGLVIHAGEQASRLSDSCIAVPFDAQLPR